MCFCTKGCSLCSIKTLMIITVIFSIGLAACWTMTDLNAISESMKSMWNSVTAIFMNEEITEINKNVRNISDTVHNIQNSVCN